MWWDEPLYQHVINSMSSEQYSEWTGDIKTYPTSLLIIQGWQRNQKTTSSVATQKCCTERTLPLVLPGYRQHFYGFQPHAQLPVPTHALHPHFSVINYKCFLGSHFLQRGTPCHRYHGRESTQRCFLPKRLEQIWQDSLQSAQISSLHGNCWHMPLAKRAVVLYYLVSYRWHTFLIN